MAITVIVTPGKQFGTSETVSNDKLNLLGQPTFAITGTVANSDLAASAVTASKTVADAYNFATAARTAGGGYDVYSLTFSPGAAPASLANGLEVWFLVPADNTQATGVKVNAGTGGDVVVYKNISQACSVGDFVAGQMVGLRYNTAIPAPITAAGWELITTPLLPASWNVTLGGTPPAYTVTLTPPAGANSITLAQLAGRQIIASVPTANAGNDTLAVTVGTASALVAKSIRRGGNQALIGGDIVVNQQVVLVYNATTDTFQLINSATAITPVAISADTRNFVAKNNAGTPNSKVDITADEVILKPLTAGGIYFLATSLSLTLDMGGTVGSPLGLDTGSEAANTWYYLWLIYNGTATSAVFSTSNSSPNLTSANLSGYKWAALVGAVRNDGSSNFVTFLQFGRDTFINASSISATLTGSTGYTLLSVTNAAAQTTLTTLIPPNAKKLRGRMGNTNSGAQRNISVAADVNGLGAQTLVGTVTASTFDGFDNACPFEIPLKTTQDFAHKMFDTGATYSIDIVGYSI